jgi:tetraacyldisaccharide 4'-kinase
VSLQGMWYRSAHPIVAQLLSPLSAVFKWASNRRMVRLKTIAKPFEVPVIVVGNITVGGTGKTPMIQWLLAQLMAEGLRVAIVSRGYGGKSKQFPLVVDPRGDATLAGDEATLLAQSTHCPVIVDPNRPQAVSYAIATHHPDVILSDDGMQHYAMHRDLEIVMVDSIRGFGNGRLLPAGPLREPLDRLETVDHICVKQVEPGPLHHSIPKSNQVNLLPVVLGSLRQVVGIQGVPVDAFVHLVAGIGDPHGFFSVAEAMGFRGQCHAFADHHAFSVGDFAGFSDAPIIMTEKDWVKCAAFATQFSQVYVLPMTFDVPDALRLKLIQQIHQLVKGKVTP